MAKLGLLVAYILLVQLTRSQFVPALEKVALLAFFNSTGGAQWLQSQGWNATSDPCADAWFGVTCCSGSHMLSSHWSKIHLQSRGGSGQSGSRVRGKPYTEHNQLPRQASLHIEDGLLSVCSLELPGNALSGQLPRSISSLRGLRSLNLAENALHGPLPETLSSLSRLQQVDVFSNAFAGPLPSFERSNATLRFLDLSQNAFSGTVPGAWRHLAALRELYVSDNCIVGDIPPWIGSLRGLLGLDVSSNALSGTVSPALGSLSGLQVLSLYNNSFHGTIPHELSQLAQLSELDLGSNQLDGSIPPAFGELVNLQGLFLDRNLLRGGIPASLGRLGHLQQLALSFNTLTGPLPRELATCTALWLVDLNNNALQGGLPAEWAAWTRLQQLNLAHNELTGGLSPQLVASWRDLRFLDLADNSFSGSIPAEIGLLASLETLYLDENAWSGPIPSSLCNTTTLTSLVLSAAQVSGNIPSCIGDLRRLQVLDLSETQLSGTLPLSMRNLTQLTYLGLERTLLRGNPWPVVCALRSLRQLYMMDALFEAPLPRCVGQLSQLQDLLLADSRFYGNLPQEMTSLSFLQRFDAQHNLLTGCLPSGWGNLVALTFFTVAHNAFNCTIPADIGAASALQVLDLSSNSLQGGIPLSVCGLRGLSSLFLDANRLSGSIPPCLQDLQSLVILALNLNGLTGELPRGLFSLPLLQVVNIGQNKGLLGQLQAQPGVALFSLPRLYQLDFSETSLSGHIMANMEGLPRLQSLNLQRARFSGGMDPRLAERCPHLRVLAVDENAFTGHIPALPASLQTALIAKNDLEGRIPSLGSVVNLTYFFADANPRLSAPPPDDMWHLSKLRVFSAPFCSLHGYLPASLLQLGLWSNSSLVNVTLQGNTLHGELPPLDTGGDMRRRESPGATDDMPYTSVDTLYTDGSWSDATSSTSEGVGGASLRLLDLSSNHFWGEIPPSWELLQVAPLSSLKLQLNFLSGSLAPLRGLRNLTELLVLEGSVFSCWSRTWHPFMGNTEHLPEQVLRLDPQAPSYQCAWTSWAAPWTALVVALLTMVLSRAFATYLRGVYPQLACPCTCTSFTPAVKTVCPLRASCAGRCQSGARRVRRWMRTQPSIALGVAVAAFFGCVMLPSYTGTTSLFSAPAEYRFTMVGVTRLPVPWFGCLFFAIACALWAFAAHQSGTLSYCPWCRVRVPSVHSTAAGVGGGEMHRLLAVSAPNASPATLYKAGSAPRGASNKATASKRGYGSIAQALTVTEPVASTAMAVPSRVMPRCLRRWQQRVIIQACMLVAFVLAAAAGDLVLVLVQNNYADWQQRLSGAVAYVELMAALYRVLLFTLALPFAVVALDMCALDEHEEARRTAEAAAFELPPQRRRRVLQEAPAVATVRGDDEWQPEDGLHSSRSFVLCILLFKLALIPLGVLLIRSEACYADFMPWVPLPTDTVSWEYEVCVVLEPVVQQTNASFALCNNDPNFKAVISREVQVTPPLRWQFSCASAGIRLFGPQMALTLAIQGVVYLVLAFARRACASRAAQAAAAQSRFAIVRETPFVCRRTAAPWSDMEPYLRRRIGMFHATQQAAIVAASALYGVGYPLAGIAGGAALVAQAQAQAILRPGMPQSSAHLPAWSAAALPLLFSGALWFFFGPISLITDSDMPRLVPLLWLLSAASAAAGAITVMASYCSARAAAARIATGR